MSSSGVSPRVTARLLQGGEERGADPSPHADFSLVWHRDSANSSVAGLVDVVRELRDGGTFLPPELER
jgi:hypothetical protein